MPVRHTTHALMLLAVALVGGCNANSTTQPTALTTQASAEAALLKEALPAFAKSHNEKIQLSSYAGSILCPIDPVFKPFYENMAVTQQALSEQLMTWAHEHNVSLRFAYPAGLRGEAQKLQEQRQEAVARGDKQVDFERDMLIDMAQDYEWQVCMIKSLQPKVSDPALKAYLAKSLEVHEAGLKEIAPLLKKYKLSK